MAVHGRRMNLLHDPRYQLIGCLTGITLLLLYLARRVIGHCGERLGRDQPAETRAVCHHGIHAIFAPIGLLIVYYGLYWIARIAVAGLWFPPRYAWVQPALHRVGWLGIFLAGLWFFSRAARVLDLYLRARAARTRSRMDDVLLPLVGAGIRVTLPILGLFLLIRLWPLSPGAFEVVQKLLSIALIAAVTILLRRAILLTEKAVVGPGTAIDVSNFHARALATRVSVLRKVAMVIVGVFAFSAVLMMFDEVRAIGKSILASAGIAGIVLGFAAQKSLGTLFAGIQIALTQPVRIGDQVMLENEVGFVEEITLTYFVVRIWDLRRLVLPISYLIEKPIQNWTRASSNLLNTVTLRTDFTFPVERLRSHMKQVIEASPHWDKKAFAVQVTNADSDSMEVRIMGSAADAGASFDLQCELREKAIDFIHRFHPQCLPKRRQESKPIVQWRVTEETEPRLEIQDQGEAA